MAVCSQIHTKHINTVCGQNVELLNVKMAVHIVTTGLQRSKLYVTYFRSVNVYCTQLTIHQCPNLQRHFVLQPTLHLPSSDDCPPSGYPDSSDASNMAFVSGGWTQEETWDASASIQETFVNLWKERGSVSRL